MNRLRFYEVEPEYIAHLKKFDRQVPDFNYTINSKFVCGIVLSINGFNYFAPVSSFNKPQSTNILILDKGRPISSIRFCFMFPVPESELILCNFSNTPKPYKDLINSEIMFCNNNVEKIRKRANAVYKISANKNHPLNKMCCDFPLLESVSAQYTARKEAAAGTESKQ